MTNRLVGTPGCAGGQAGARLRGAGPGSGAASGRR